MCSDISILGTYLAHLKFSVKNVQQNALHSGGGGFLKLFEQPIYTSVTNIIEEW